MRSPHTRFRPRQATAIGAAALLFAGMSGVAAPAAFAARADVYTINIMSSGMAIQFHDPNLVLQPDVQLGPYTALADLDNLGQSTAQAGAPFLGEYVGPLVGHFNGLGAGQIPPFPPVPGEVRSSYPGQPDDAQRNGGYAIEAKSTGSESTGTVSLGAAPPGSSHATLFSIAHALVDEQGALNAVGSSGVDLLNLGGVLDIGRVASSITMTQSGSGEPTFLTTTDIGTITVSCQKYGLDETGKTGGGTNSGAFADQVNQATQALAASGLSIRYLPAGVTYRPGTRTVDSVRSGAVEVSYQHDVPTQGLVVNTLTLGYVQISATSQTVGSAGTEPPADSALQVHARSLHTVHSALKNQPRMSADDRSVSIITPTLKMMRFGSTLGLPDGCNIVAGSLGAGVAEAGGGDQAGSALATAVENCTMFGNSGGEQLTAAMAAVAPLAVLNPVFDPGIEAFADALETLGRDHAGAVAPFGPTLVGLASSARFFKGCGTTC
jgi:hypothetical protein